MLEAEHERVMAQYQLGIQREAVHSLMTPSSAQETMKDLSLLQRILFTVSPCPVSTRRDRLIVQSMLLFPSGSDQMNKL